MERHDERRREPGGEADTESSTSLIASGPGPRSQNVLWVSNETPDRFGQGGQRRQYFQIAALTGRGHRVHVVALAGPQSDRSVREIASVERVTTGVRGIRIPFAERRAGRRAVSGRYDRIVVSHAESLWQVERIGSAHAPLLVDLHNVYSAWHRLHGRTELAAASHAEETRALRMADVVSVCSEAELDRLEREHGPLTIPVLVLPHGVDPAEWPGSSPASDPAYVALFGSWDWSPNLEGIEWFLRDVWPSVAAAVPALECRIAGSVRPALDLPARTSWVGRVPDLAAFLGSATAVAVPVVRGVGASVKFAEALAAGAPVIATVDAASAHSDAPVMVSDDAQAWVRHLVRLTTDPPSRPDASRDHALASLSWDRVTDRLARWVASA